MHRRDERDLDVAIRGDDFVEEGESHQLNCSDKVGAVRSVRRVDRQGRGLKRIVTRSAERFPWEADPTLTVGVMEVLGMSSATATRAPGMSDIGNNDRCVHEELPHDAGKAISRPT